MAGVTDASWASSESGGDRLPLGVPLLEEADSQDDEPYH